MLRPELVRAIGLLHNLFALRLWFRCPQPSFLHFWLVLLDFQLEFSLSFVIEQVWVTNCLSLVLHELALLVGFGLLQDLLMPHTVHVCKLLLIFRFIIRFHLVRLLLLLLDLLLSEVIESIIALAVKLFQAFNRYP